MRKGRQVPNSGVKPPKLPELGRIFCFWRRGELGAVRGVPEIVITSWGRRRMGKTTGAGWHSSNFVKRLPLRYKFWCAGQCGRSNPALYRRSPDPIAACSTHLREISRDGAPLKDPSQIAIAGPLFRRNGSGLTRCRSGRFVSFPNLASV